MAYEEATEAWIVGAVRTPIGKHDALSTVRPDDLGTLVLENLMQRTGVAPEAVEDVYTNEAYAAQSLAVLHERGMDPEDERLNPNGGGYHPGAPHRMLRRA